MCNWRPLPVRFNTQQGLCSDEHSLRPAARHGTATADSEAGETTSPLRACSIVAPSVFRGERNLNVRPGWSGVTTGTVNIDGKITSLEDGKISVLDHGFIFGDSIYETMRTYRGKPFLFSKHFARLE